MMLMLHVDTSPEYGCFLFRSYGTRVPSAVMCDDDVISLLLLLGDSVISDLLEIRNNKPTLFLTSQIYVAYLTYPVPCPSSRG